MNVLDPKFINRWAVAIVGSLIIHIVVACYFFSGNTGRAPDPVDANASVTTEPNATSDPAAKPEATDPAPPPPVTEEPRPVRPTTRPPRTNANTRNTVPAATANTPPAATDAAPKTKSYRVKKGDNLTHIARDCGSTPAELAKLNGVSEKQLANLKVGQIIKIKAAEE